MVNKRPRQYIYSYDYEPGENWGNPVSEADVYAFLHRKDVENEIKDTVDKTVNCAKHGHKKIFFLIADTHYTVNGNWEYTIEIIKSVAQQLDTIGAVKLSGIIHLGDFTDGMLSKEVCKEYSAKVINGLKEMKAPIYPVIGNHDSNYFKNNPEAMIESEQYEMYIKKLGLGEKYEKCCDGLCYVEEVPGSDLAVIALSAYSNNEKHRYGYNENQIEWILKQLNALPANKKVIILSHGSPIKEMDYWADEIRNGDKLVSCLEEWNINNNKRIVGMFVGHIHADYVCDKLSFPMIATGCSKLEYFEDRKPKGAITPVRYENEVSQELWDVLIVDEESGDIRTVRFGAGEDRNIEKNVPKKTPAVWAHRGASGYAPENTLPSFELATLMGAESVELDVQFTKDGELVVIHDETINRTIGVTCGVGGYVCDYTLEELKSFNFNCSRFRPEFEKYGFVSIPTLREVFELLKPTGLGINVELKTGVKFYPGIENSVSELVHEMGMEDRIIYSSFNHESVMRIKDIDSDIPCGFLYSDGIDNPADYAAAHGVYAIHPDVKNTRYPKLVSKAHEKNVRVNVWAVNNEDQMKRMNQLGADAVITDYPDVALRLYKNADVDTDSLVDLVCKKYYTKDSSCRRGILHIVGECYRYVRAPFAGFDRWVQRMARRR